MAYCASSIVLIFGKDQTEHDARLMTVLNHFRQAHIALNEKCEFYKSLLKFASQVISGNCISVDSDKPSVVPNMAPLTNTKEIRCLLGMANQLAKFSSSLTDTSATL